MNTQVISILLLMKCFVNEMLVGFDPIFFLHHCNVDRLYAFWEYLYPNYWIGEGWKSSKTGMTVPFSMCISHPVSLDHHSCSPGTDSGTFYSDANAPVGHATPLHPFRTEELKYWTSDDTRGLLNTSPTNKCRWFFHLRDPVMNDCLNRLHIPCHQGPQNG